MGRFASTVDFYSRCREPYPATFFTAAATQLALRGSESLLDVGCGPGVLTLGFAPFVRRAIGLDPEPAMLDAAKRAAAATDLPVSFLLGRIEEFTAADAFAVVTIGRALHWLDRNATLPVLERIVSNSGRILTCGAFSVEHPTAPWVKTYDDVRDSYVSATEKANEACYRIDPLEWFAGSRFEQADAVEVAETREVAISDLVGRALSKSNTSPEKLGARRSAFEADIAATLEPFAHDGVLQEQIVARATIFARSVRP
ncbi:MAG TPA: class I SAM-dependent methyltransferase [Candidatus Acidoferrum sp.]|nr:class I SAM-dependent methyltransferase [Candidatus Acidoferrum sp.]